MATILTGDVNVVRVDELLDVSLANIRDKKLLTDLITDSKSAKVSVPNLESVLIHDNISTKNIAAIGQSFGHIDTAQPIVFPTLTTTERNAVATPNTSMKIFNSTTAQFEKYNGAAWESDGAAAIWQDDTSLVTLTTDRAVRIKGETNGTGAALLTVRSSTDVDVLIVDDNGKMTIDTGQNLGPDTGLWFGDGDSGLYELVDDRIAIKSGTTQVCYLSANGYTAGIGPTGAARISVLQSTSILPAYSFVNDSDTGIGRPNTADQMSLIAGGFELMRLDNAASVKNVEINGNIFNTQIKSGATQVAASAAANEIWKTASHATLPDNVLMIGV